MAKSPSSDELAIMAMATPTEETGVSSSDTLLAEPQRDMAGPGKTDEDFAGAPSPGDTIGRFVVRAVLGRGGMGVVVSAHDPRLEREVAIKLVRSNTGGSDAEVGGRLLREARAMAKFRHPNIVSVFEVGEHQGQIYVAMEQVEGGTLRELVDRMEADGDADWRVVLELFAKAGRGLAAAHSTGMVHRDFKPDNVLIDRHDRVLVSDFGIVSESGSMASNTGGERLFSDQLTHANEVVGTPAYMAPEQHAGASVDARADQFSFCVALYEALYGQLPFAGSTYATYLASLRSGQLQAPPSGKRVPEWLVQILTRGLSCNPDDRFESMDQLLVELGVDTLQSHGLGGRERLALIAGLAAFVIAWAVAVAGLDVELSYTLHYQTDAMFLVLVAVLGWVARHALARSEFNRRVFQFVLVTAISLLVLVAGGQRLGLTPDAIGALHMLVIGTASLVAMNSFGYKVLPMASCYLIGFLLSATWPRLFLPLLVTGHCMAAATSVLVHRLQPR